jgi:hypothetical protein
VNWNSTKLWSAIIGVGVLALNRKMGLDLNVEQVVGIVATLAAFMGSKAFEDVGKAKADALRAYNAGAAVAEQAKPASGQ